MSLNQDAITRLLAVKQHILEEPRRFDMAFIRSERSQAPCGTTCCIAGWLLKLDKPELKPDRIYWRGGDMLRLGGDEAADLLGISYEAAYTLFHEDDWPEALREAYWDAATAEQRAKAGADAIDSFIAAGGEW